MGQREGLAAKAGSVREADCAGDSFQGVKSRHPERRRADEYLFSQDIPSRSRRILLKSGQISKAL
jgi:hypothetical protein